jgi:S1-C subfamily serine protease
VSDQALAELHKRRPEINVDRISEAYLGAGFRSDLGSLQVAAVRPNSPAARAGFAEKDVLVEFASEPVSDFRTFRALTFTLKPGQKVAAKLERQGKPVNVTIEMGSWD